MKAVPADVTQDAHLSTEHLQSSLKQRFVKGGAVTLISQLLKFSLQLGSNIILARLLLPEDYGLFGMTIAITRFISLFKDLGLSAATIQRKQLNHQQVSSLFWVNVVVSFCVCLITAAIAPLIAFFYQEPILVNITLALSIGYLMGGLTVQHQAILSRQMRFTELGIIDVAAMALGILIAILLGLRGFGVWALVHMQLATGLTHLIGVWITCPWRPGAFHGLKSVGSLLIFGRNLTGFNIINYISRNIDNVLIGRVWGAQALGFYAKAYQLLLLPIQQINTPISRVAIPALSRLTHDPDRYRAAYLRILKKVCLITLPLIAFMIGTSDWLVLFILGPQWQEASHLFAVLGIMAFTQPIANTTGWLFTTQDRTWHQFKWGVLGGGITIGSIILGLPWGPLGVALAFSLSGLLIRTPLLFWFVGRTGPVKTTDFYITVVPYLFAAILSLGSITLYRVISPSPHLFLNISFGLIMTVLVSSVILVSFPSSRVELTESIQVIHNYIQSKQQK